MGKKTKPTTPEEGHDIIHQVPINEQFKKDFGCYTYFVALQRICPDYRDGLLNSHRAIISAASLFTHAETKFVKSAAIVGDVMKYLHPHGDMSIYGTMTRLGTYYNCRYPLIDKTGCFGTIDGDQAASHRYTEARLSEFARLVLTDDLKPYSDDVAVDWIDNYSKDAKIPEYLPAKLPLLLLKGMDNIGVGDKISVPSHNLCEVVDACITLMHNPNANIVLIPDLPLPCDIVDTDWKKISKTGIGKFTARAIVNIEPYHGPKKSYAGRQTLRVLSLPPQVRLGAILERVADLVKERKIVQIEDYESDSIDDEHGELTVDLSFILSEGADPNYVKMLLYKHTDLQKSYGINLQVKKDNQRVRCGYKDYLMMFINYRRVHHARLMYNQITELKTRDEKLSSFVELIDSGKFDQIQQFIRTQKEDVDLVEIVVNKFKVNPVQAHYAVSSTMAKQSKFARDKMVEEVKANEAKAEELLNIVRNPALIDAKIIDEMTKLKEKLGDARRCRVVKKGANGPSGRFLVCVSDSNKIKIQGLTEPLTCSKGDNIRTVIDMDVSSALLVFTDNGRCYRIPGEKIPFSPAGTSGEDVRVINKNVGGNIVFITSEEIMNEAIERKDFLISLSKSGFIKKVSLDDFSNVPVSGTIFSKIDQGDKIIDVCFTRPDMRVIVYNNDKALCLGMDDISWVKRNSRGSCSMKSEFVEGMTPILPNMTDLLVVTSKGLINRISPITIKSGRAKAGSSVIKLKAGDSIHSIIAVEPGHVIRAFCTNEIIDIPVESIKIGSTVSSGVKCIKQSSGDILKVTVI